MTPSPHPDGVSVSGDASTPNREEVGRAIFLALHGGDDDGREWAAHQEAWFTAADRFLAALPGVSHSGDTGAPTGALSDLNPSIPQGESTAAVSGGEHDEGPFSALVDAEWQTLLDKDDRTSPEDYPDMCLVTRTELACAMTEAFVYGTSLPPPPAAGQDLSEAVLDGSTDKKGQ